MVEQAEFWQHCQMNSAKRMEMIRQLYAFMDLLEGKAGGKRLLSSCNGKMNWPERGVYFFFEPNEERSTSGSGPRIVRVGTHAVSAGSRSTLWKRLRTHRGNLTNGSGNHRGSIFRLHVGTAFINKHSWDGDGVSTWGKGSTESKEIRAQERWIEQKVSKKIGAMPFLWLAVGDPSSKTSKRAYIERNVIALLSNTTAGQIPIDPPSDNWLGSYAKHADLRSSGLWNVKHVREDVDDELISILHSFL